MSFIRFSKSGPGNKNIRKTKKLYKPKAKPQWDSTIQDLDVYRASSEDIAYRKAVHRSKHLMKEYLIQGDNSNAEGNVTGINSQQVAVLKELLLDRQQLQDVLNRSDKMLGVVKDMFGDDPKRYTGFPNVTTAPGINPQQMRPDLVSEVPELSSRMEALSQSVMDETALNDDVTDRGDAINFQSKLDLRRFQQFLESQEAVDASLSSIYPPTHTTIDTTGQMGQNIAGPAGTSQSIADGSMFCTPTKQHNESIAILRTPPSAVNDTKKINRTRPAFMSQQAHIVSHNSQHIADEASILPRNNTTIVGSDLKKVMTDLDAELSTLEHTTSPRSWACHSSDTFSGYTAVLVNAVTKLARHLKQTDIQLKAEAFVREQLTENMQELRALVDALTGDLISTQEEFGQVLREFSRYRLDMEGQQAHIVACLESSGLWVPMEHTSPPAHTAGSDAVTTVPPSKHPEYTVSLLPQDDHVVNPLQPRTLPPDVLPSPQLSRVQGAARAVLLSPPVQKSRLHSNAVKPKPRADHIPMNPSNQPTIVTIPKPVSLAPDFHPSNLSQHYQSQDSDHYLPRGSVDRFVSSSHRNTIALPQIHPDHSHHDPYRSHIAHSIQADLGAIPDGRSIFTQNSNLTVDKHRPDDSSLGGYGDTRVDLRHERVELASQIAELNREHEEAQRRLESLMMQQNTGAVNAGSEGIDSQTGMSASVSSISQHTLSSSQHTLSSSQHTLSSSQHTLSSHLAPPTAASKIWAHRITVAIPTVDLDTSRVSAISPLHQ